MRSKIFIVSTITALLCINVSVAVAADNTDQTQPAAQTANPQQSDAQIFGDLVVLNTNEVNAGKLAVSKTSNADVKKFAEHMEKDHSKNRSEAISLAKKLSIQPVDSDTSADLKKQGDDEATKLQALSGKEFDQEYVDAMVKGHKGALDFLDKELSKANNPKLIAFLKETRATVAHHLEMAETLSKKLTQAQ